MCANSQNMSVSDYSGSRLGVVSTVPSDSIVASLKIRRPYYSATQFYNHMI